MAEYKTCEFYGSPECCGTQIDAFTARVEHFEVRLTYINGSLLNVKPWQVHEVIETKDSWIARRQNTAEYLAVDQTILNHKSRHLYARHHHWGQTTVHKMNACPYK